MTLEEMRTSSNRVVIPKRRQKVNVAPGCSVTEEDLLQAGT